YGYALDSDGAVGSLVTTAPYQAKINATVTGTAAHAGVAPEKGISAISVAAKAIAKTKLGRIDEETTANIGYFKGGKSTETNVDRKSTRLNSSHVSISYAVFCLKKTTQEQQREHE